MIIGQTNYFEKTFGFYDVNGQKFTTKIAAVLEANKTLADVKWEYNDDTFAKYKWDVEPLTSLSELYKQRAKQIREQYDYVILMLSGGGDSTNMLYSFLENGIHVDEVIASAPVSGLKNWETDPNNKNADQQISETFLAQFPLLKIVAERWPNVKITINDYFDTIINFKTDEWIFKGSTWLHPTASRHDLSGLTHIRQLGESGKRVAKVYGIDKPVLARGPSGKLYNCIFDGAIQQPNHQTTTEGFNTIETVLFYITPDMPELMIKQCHVLAKWMYSGVTQQAKYAKMTMLDKTAPVEFQRSMTRTSVHHRAIIPAIYPALDGMNIWQAHKSNVTLSGPHDIIFDTWIAKLHKNEKIWQQVFSDGRHVFDGIDKKYFNLAKDYKILAPFAKYYSIGHESQFISDISLLNTNYDFSSDLIKATELIY
jgi:hypothetical protein